ncbi:hypothetical protein JCM11641_001856 [Rhodosporidiobolus odoratus]
MPAPVPLRFSASPAFFANPSLLTQQRPSTCSTSSTTSSRRSTLTFKGPLSAKRLRAPPKNLDPVPPKRAPAKRKTDSRRNKTVPVKASLAGSRQGKVAEGLSAKARGKRKRVEVEDEEKEGSSSSDDDASDEDDPAGDIRPYERPVARSAVQQRWKVLSETAREEIRWELEREARKLLDALPSSSSSRSTQSLSLLLTRYTDEIETLLTTLPVPPLPSALRTGRAKGKGREMDLGLSRSASEMMSRIVTLEHAYEEEQAQITALEKRVEEGRRLLEEEEAALLEFEEAKHPLVRPLLQSRISLTIAQSLRDRSVNLSIPGLKRRRSGGEEDNAAAVAGEAGSKSGRSREWFRPLAFELSGTDERKKGADDEEGGKEEDAGSTSALTRRLERATKVMRKGVKEKRKGRKTSESLTEYLVDFDTRASYDYPV